MSNENADVFFRVIEIIGNASLGLQISREKGLGKEAVVRLRYPRYP